MSQQPNATNIYILFLSLLEELEDFVETRDLKLAFDREKRSIALRAYVRTYS